MALTPQLGQLDMQSPTAPKNCLRRVGLDLDKIPRGGREAKHIKLAAYVQNTCNVNKNQRWWMVFRHEYVSMVWLREYNPHSITYCPEKRELVTRTSLRR